MVGGGVVACPGKSRSTKNGFVSFNKNPIIWSSALVGSYCKERRKKIS